MKIKAFFQKSMNEEKTLVAECKRKEEAIEALLNFAETKVDYCLDSRKDRKEALEMRNTCICGCGPASMYLEEV